MFSITHKIKDIVIRRLCFAIFLLTLGDAVGTAAGINLCILGEGNPFWHEIISRNPAAVSAAAVAATGGLLAVIYRFRLRCGYVTNMLIGVWALKVVVIGLHLCWILIFLTT